ncbi:uncharacterized protein LOC113639573 isoform X2 [Tachysurus fulvidraco]|uniref:uncharacterized protein LOC113639573 isoform X2 n=1 Tax=Tachysurus fulvidraco TaxID=1234273 RepID=UPI000F4DBA95|nr:uncharacterized protein LOC113639573 isoform X2 [Tachysurus fulvidraco]
MPFQLPRRKVGVSGVVGKTPSFKKKSSPIMRRMLFCLREDFIPTMDNAGQNSHTDWLPKHLTICSASEEYITGIVSTEEELKQLLESHKRASGTSYTIWSDDSHKKQKVTPRCLWKVEDYSEHVPLSVKRRVIYACTHGKNYKKTTTTDDLHTEHEYTRRKRFHNQNSKKVDCPAKLYVRYVERYDQFAVAKTSSRTERQVAIKGVLESLKENTAVTSEIIHVKIPLAGAHKNHNTSQNCYFSNNIHCNVALKQDSQSNEIANQEDLCFDVIDSPVPCTGKQIHSSESQSPDVAVDQRHLREQLKTLHDISYICTDKEAIRNASRVVHGLCETLKSSLPKDFLVLQQQEPAKKNLKALPSPLKKVKQKTSWKHKTVAIENEDFLSQGKPLTLTVRNSTLQKSDGLGDQKIL